MTFVQKYVISRFMKMSNDGKISEKHILEQVENLLNYKKNTYKDDSLIDNIKEVCVDRLCSAVGVECEYNYKSDFFNFYAEIFGQAVVDLLGINLVIASDIVRLFKHNHINLVEQVRMNIEEILIRAPLRRRQRKARSIPRRRFPRSR